MLGLVMELMAALFAVAVSLGCTSACLGKRRTDAPPSVLRFLGGAILAIVGIVGILWCSILSPPPFSQRVPAVGPATRLNDPFHSIYLGNGCFWHTQYDLVLLEQDSAGPFGGRPDAHVSSLVGYGGGNYASPGGGGGAACYHGIPGTDYGRLGHAEAVSVELSAQPSAALRQVAALSELYFAHGFRSRSCSGPSALGCVDTPGAGWQRRQRLDPADAGPMYRNVIGLPGGLDNRTLMALVEAANVYAMPLLRGGGGPEHDGEGEYVVYVYDSLKHPFYRGEKHHQFHTNDVVRRYVPPSYTDTLKARQVALGRMDGHGCLDPPGGSMLTLLWPLLLAAPLGAGVALLFAERALLDAAAGALRARPRGPGGGGGGGGSGGSGSGHGSGLRLAAAASTATRAASCTTSGGGSGGEDASGAKS